MIHYADDTVTLHAGDSLEIARELPDQSVQTIVTSPPYFGLRDYGTDGQFGAEASVDEYVGNLVALFSELHRVLANDGTAWINLGDSYSGSRGGPQGASGEMAGRAVADHRQGVQTRNVEGLGKKNLIGVPWRVAFALQADGWILRKDVIWHKPNAMPESVTDRPTSAHEHIFFLSKSVNYYYDADAVRSVKSKGHTPGRTWEERKAAGAPSRHGLDGARESGFGTAAGSNLRDVWSVPTVPFTEAHFAVYPPELIRPCVLASSRPGDVVLDPFSGSGTTGMVATEEGRRYLGIDLNAEYLDLSLRTRFLQPTLGIA